MKTRLKLQGKIIALILTSVLIVFAAIIGTTTYINRREGIENARQLVSGMSREYANRVRAELEVAMEAARSLSNMLTDFRVGDGSDRDKMNLILANALKRNPKFSGVWCCWEPNAFDGMDDRFAGTEGHDETGRFIPFWFRDGDQVTMEPLTGYDSEEENEWYTIPMKNKGETVLEPYFDDQVEKTLVSLAVPLEKEGKRLGIVGVDLDMAGIDQIIKGLTLYDTGFGRLVSYSGVVASHPDGNMIGKTASEIRDQGGKNVLERIQRGDSWIDEIWSDTLGQMTIKSFAPIPIGNTGTPWSLSLVAREDEITASSTRIFRITMAMAASGTAAITAIVWLITLWIVKPIRKVSQLAARAQGGDLTIERADFCVESKNEIGSMADALSDMVKKQRSSIKTIAEAAARLGMTAEEFSALVEESNAGVEESRTGVEEIASQMENLATASEEISASAQEVALGAKSSSGKIAQIASELNSAGTSGKSGALTVEKASIFIKQVAQDASDGAVAIKLLSDRAREIQNFVEQIGSIAAQTNLLALNAAIEAARAGDAGKGFAVVAQEVRNLAESSNEAAQKIAALAEKITQDLEKAAASSERNAEESKKSSDLAEETRLTIESMMEELSAISTAVHDLASVSEEQAASSEEISLAVQGIASGVSSASKSSETTRRQMAEVGTSAERVALGAENLSSLSEELREMVGLFRV